jgi:hypothetical protein
VFESKNFSQFAVICATAPELAGLLAAGLLGAGLLGAPELPVAAGDEPVAAELLELLLLQAATVAASARPAARAITRRAKGLNRMTRLLCLGRMGC